MRRTETSSPFLTGMVVVTCGSSNPNQAKAGVSPGGQQGKRRFADQTNY